MDVVQRGRAVEPRARRRLQLEKAGRLMLVFDEIARRRDGLLEVVA